MLGWLIFFVQTGVMFLWGLFWWIPRIYLKRIFDAQLSAVARLEAFIDLYESFDRQLLFKLGFRFWRAIKWRVYYEHNVVNKLLPLCNNREWLKVKLLRGFEDGQVLIDLMEKGSSYIFLYCGIDANRSHWRAFMRRADGTYICPRWNHKQKLEDIDPEDPTMWGHGQDTPISVETVRNLYEPYIKRGGIDQVWNFSTVVSNQMFSDLGEDY